MFDHTRVADVEIDQNNPNLLYAVSQSWYGIWLPNINPGVYKSSDGGNTWNNITGNLSHTLIDFIKLNPNNTSQLFVGTGGGGLWARNLVTGIEEDNVSFPAKFGLHQNYPNPFNPSTTISYSIPSVGRNLSVLLKVYDVLGREVATLVNEEKSAGIYKVNFNASSLASGIYFYRIITGSANGGFVQTKKMILLK
ncbi:MAG TPA: T9SS type A sorting domain-containing protein [Ignavibacteria bacterium]|nr:T9SS type A sorting domain-containing protein [Ignavibacteria bacterium]